MLVMWLIGEFWLIVQHTLTWETAARPERRTVENFMLVSLVVEVVCCLGVLGWIGLRREDSKRLGEDDDEQHDPRGRSTA